MESLFFLIPVALVFCAVAIRLLLWAIDTGQYDDLDKEGWRVLADDDEMDGERRSGSAPAPEKIRGTGETSERDETDSDEGATR